MTRCRRLLSLWLVLLPTVAQARLVPADPHPLGPRLPVILIHGWNTDAATWDPLLAAAGRHASLPDRCRLYRFEYDWSRSIAVAARQLEADLAATGELRDRPVVLVGHSMGGLVARALAESSPAAFARVGRLVTLGTPHHGTPVANLGWVAGDSRYSWAVKLLPFGLSDLLDRLPISRAARTEGGQQLGYDNYDGQMPTELWAGANRYVSGLNERFANLADRDEHLRRYRFVGGYRTAVGNLTLLGLQWQVARGQHYAAGGSLLAHGYGDAQGGTVRTWLANDGVVPLDSALFLRPGPPLADLQGEQVRLLGERWRLRAWDPGGVAPPVPEADHTATGQGAGLIGPLLDDLAATDCNGLLVTAGGRLMLWRPGGAALPLLATPAGGTLLAVTPDRLVLRDSGRLLAVTPRATQLLARGPETTSWSVSPAAHWALDAGGALHGLTRAAYTRLDPVPTRGAPPLFAPDDARLAWAAPGGVRLLDPASLRQTDVTLAGPDWRPLGWSADGTRLWCLAGRAERCAPSPDGRSLAVVVTGGGRVAAVTSDGQPTSVLSYPEAGPRLLLVDARGVTTLGGPATALAWSPDSAWLAWSDGAALRVHGTAPATITAPGATWSHLVAVAGSGLLAVRQVAGQPAELVLVPTMTRQPRVLASGAEPGLPAVSPDGRHVAWPVADRVVVARLDGGGSVSLTGTSPAWLPLPAHRGWELAGR